MGCLSEDKDLETRKNVLCTDKELLMMGSLPLIKELPISIKIQLFSKYQITNSTSQGQFCRNGKAF